MEATKFLVSEKIGPSMGWTNEKFLICYSVPVARTGMLLYSTVERPEVQPGPDGLIRIDRDPDDVFEPESIQSLQGKPLLNDHPDFDVNPQNYQSLTIGTVLNPRRGDGLYDDCVVADIVVMDADAILDVQAGKREVSGGYTCKYFDLGGGRGRQSQIRFNHVALVESGRCGSRCSIKDHSMRGETDMSTLKKPRPWLDKLRTLAGVIPADQKPTFDAVMTEAEKEELTEPGKDRTEPNKDSADLTKRMDELESRHATHDRRINTHDSEITGLKEMMEKKADKETKDAGKEDDKEIEGELEEEAPPGTGDGKMKMAKDSALLAPTWNSTKALAEILTPGVQIPTFDHAADPKVSYRGICAFRKRVLGLSLLTVDTNEIITAVRNGRTLDAVELEKMTCPEVRQLFVSAGVAKKAANTRDAAKPGSTSNTVGSGGGMGAVGGVSSIAELNKKNRDAWSGSK